MEGSKEILLDSIFETKKELSDIKTKLQDLNKKLPDIASLSRSLMDIQKVINTIKDLCDEACSHLVVTFYNMNNIEENELIANAQMMFEIINDNILVGLELRDSPAEREKAICYLNEEVGKISVQGQSGGALRVEVKIKENSELFHVIKPSKVHPIISYINAIIK